MRTPPASRVPVGGDCIIIGLFTRFFAAAFAIEMLIDLLFVQLPKGYSAGDGYDPPSDRRCDVRDRHARRRPRDRKKL